MARYSPEYVLGHKNKDNLKGIVFVGSLILVFEIYTIINMIAYQNVTGTSYFYDYFLAWLQLFQPKSLLVEYNLDTLIKIIKILPYFILPNILILFMMWSGIRKKSGFIGVENGSAEWANSDEKADFKDYGNSIPIADGMYLDYKNKMIEHLNEFVIGDTGVGKSFRKLIPDILQCIGSYVITDTKGALYRQLNYFLTKVAGYKTYVFNLYDLRYSDCFNPLVYLKESSDIAEFVNEFIKSSRREGASVGEGIWEETISFLLSSVVFYVLEKEPENKRTMPRVANLIRGIKAKKGEIDSTGEFYQKIAELRKENPEHSAVYFYDLFDSSKGDTLSSILVSCNARLTLWGYEEVRILTGKNTIDIDALQNGKTAIFVVTPDTKDTYKVLQNMFLSTVKRRLIHIADNEIKGPFENLISFELDECANAGELAGLSNFASTARSRNVRLMTIWQNEEQAKKIYEKDYRTIISSSHYVYLGTNDTETNKVVVEKLGKASIDEVNRTRNKSMQSTGGSESDRGVGRELLTVSELNKKNKNFLLFFTKYYNPFYVEKFKTENHPNFKYVGIDDTKSPYYEEKKKYNTYIQETYKKKYEDNLREYKREMNKVIEDRKSMIKSLDIASAQKQLIGEEISQNDFMQTIVKNRKK